MRLGALAGVSDMLCPQGSGGSHPSTCTPALPWRTGSFQGLCSGEPKRERLFLCQSRIKGIVHAGHVELAVLACLRRWRCPRAFSALSVPWSILLRSEMTTSLLWEPAPLQDPSISLSNQTRALPRCPKPIPAPQAAVLDHCLPQWGPVHKGMRPSPSAGTPFSCPGRYQLPSGSCRMGLKTQD